MSRPDCIDPLAMFAMRGKSWMQGVPPPKAKSMRMAKSIVLGLRGKMCAASRDLDMPILGFIFSELCSLCMCGSDLTVGQGNAKWQFI